jgi:hypothetical protein
MALKRYVIPLADLFGIQMIDDGQGIKLVQAGSYLSIFNIRQTA